MKTSSIESRAVIVTGSSVGLGAHIASLLVNLGHNAIIDYSKRKVESQALQKNLAVKKVWR